MRIVKFALIALCILVVLAISALAYMGMQSRGGSAPGLVGGQLSACPDKPNCVSSEAGTPDDKLIEPFSLNAWANLPAIIEDLGGNVTSQQAIYLSAEFTSSIFGFVDDVEFRLTETNVQVRSGSRVGHSDAGVNAKRVAELRAQLSE